MRERGGADFTEQKYVAVIERSFSFWNVAGPLSLKSRSMLPQDCTPLCSPQNLSDHIWYIHSTSPSRFDDRRMLTNISNPSQFSAALGVPALSASGRFCVLLFFFYHLTMQELRVLSKKVF